MVPERCLVGKVAIIARIVAGRWSGRAGRINTAAWASLREEYSDSAAGSTPP